PSINCHASKGNRQRSMRYISFHHWAALTVPTQIASQDRDRIVPERDCREATIIRPIKLSPSFSVYCEVARVVGTNIALPADKQTRGKSNRRTTNEKTTNAKIRRSSSVHQSMRWIGFGPATQGAVQRSGRCRRR